MGDELQNVPNPSELASAAGQLFADCPIIVRLLQSYRPYIGPFHLMLQWAQPGANVLDVGCGAGLLLGLLSWTGRIGASLGFDANGAAITSARTMARRLEKLQPSAAPLRFDHLRVNGPWPQDRYDLVCLVDVMHHVPRAQRSSLIDQLIDRVRPGGRLLYKDMCDRPLWRANANWLHDLVLARSWVRYQPLADVRRHCEQRGLQLVHTQRINMLWYGHDLLVFDKPVD